MIGRDPIRRNCAVCGLQAEADVANAPVAGTPRWSRSARQPRAARRHHPRSVAPYWREALVVERRGAIAERTRAVAPERACRRASSGVTDWPT